MNGKVRRPRQTETQEQLALLHWARLKKHDYPALTLLCHIPNGGKRHIVEATKLKTMGVKAGMPDLFLPWAEHGFHGLFIELKAPGGRVSVEQRNVILELHERGYCAGVVEGWLNASVMLLLYLDKCANFEDWYDKLRRKNQL